MDKLKNYFEKQIRQLCNVIVSGQDGLEFARKNNLDTSGWENSIKKYQGQLASTLEEFEKHERRV